MKIQIEENVTEFKPFKLTLTVETLEELKGLCGRFNLHSSEANHINTAMWEYCSDEEFLSVFEVLQRKLDKVLS